MKKPAVSADIEIVWPLFYPFEVDSEPLVLVESRLMESSAYAL